MKQLRIHFTKEKQTLLITRHAKALDYRSKNSILHDKKAKEIFSMIESSVTESVWLKKTPTTTGAEHKWAVDDPSEVDRLDSTLKRTADLPLFKSKYVQKISWK